MQYLGDYADDSTVRIFFTTSDGSGGAVAPSTAFEAADIVIYKNNSATQKATTNGITMTSPFDTVTGLHLVEIDCSNDTGDAGFWATGNDYSVVLSPDETVDSQTVVAAIAQFSIENRIVSSVTGSVSSVTTAVETDSASRTASQADVSSLATSAEISALNDFDPAADTVANVTTVGSVTSAVTTDAASRTASQADVSALATSAEIAALNDIAATDIVSAGAITTLAGAVVNVDTVDVTTTNTDMRGTDGAYTGTPATAGQIADEVWDEALSGHNVAGSTGKALRQLKQGTITIDSAINDTSATALSFVTDLTEATSSYYSNKIMVFISGHLSGQARIITSYNGTTKAITLEEALTSAPADGDEFLILATHENSIGEIQAGLATSAEVAVVDANVDQILLDTGTDGVVISTAQAQTLADEVLKRSVTNTQDSADAHSLAAIVLGILESSRSSTTWTIKKTTGSTFTTKTLTLDSEADPVIGVD
jgi:hypothetical protein